MRWRSGAAPRGRPRTRRWSEGAGSWMPGAGRWRSRCSSHRRAIGWRRAPRGGRLRPPSFSDGLLDCCAVAVASNLPRVRRRRAGAVLPWLRSRAVATPFPLVVLAVVALAQGVAWSVATAPLNGPDEVAHAAYAQYVAETGNGPFKNVGIGSTSTEMGVALGKLNLGPIIGHAGARPTSTRVDQVSGRARAPARERAQERLRPELRGGQPAAVLRLRGRRLQALARPLAAGPAVRDALRHGPAAAADGRAELAHRRRAVRVGAPARR